MPRKYSSEEVKKVLTKLPEEIKETLSAEETSNVIYGSCERNGVSEEKALEVSRYVGYVLLGLLPPNEFSETLEKELGIEAETAKKINREIEMFVFHPVRIYLEKLYRPEVTEKKEVIKKEEVIERKIPPSPKTDIYREPIEEEGKEG